MDDPRTPTGNVSQLRRKLNEKAKAEPKFKFYTLYGLIFRRDVLEAAWERVAANGGSPGIDGMSVADITGTEDGVKRRLDEIEEALRTKTYRPDAVKRVLIPKPGGGTRPLGIPTIRDRVVQTAVKLILEPIFEADFEDCSHGFRPNRSAHDALEAVRAALAAGRTEVYDGDLKAYFDTIPHDKLMACLGMRIADQQVLKLIRSWLTAVVVEPPDRPGGKPTYRRSRCGTPQGGVISPLLANAYLHWFDKVFQARCGPARWKASLVRYADDFVILARRLTEPMIEFVEAKLEGRLKLTINRDKTRRVDLTQPNATLDFLGFTFRFDRDRFGRDRRYLNLFPSAKAVVREKMKLREMISARSGSRPLPNLIASLNRHLAGWWAYFEFGYPSAVRHKLNHFVVQRLMRHLRRRSQRPYRKPTSESFPAFFKRLGLKLP